MDPMQRMIAQVRSGEKQNSKKNIKSSSSGSCGSSDVANRFVYHLPFVKRSIVIDDVVLYVSFRTEAVCRPGSSIKPGSFCSHFMCDLQLEVAIRVAAHHELFMLTMNCFVIAVSSTVASQPPTVVRLPKSREHVGNLVKCLKKRRAFFELARLFGWSFDEGDSAWPTIESDPTPNALLCSADAEPAFWGALSDPHSDLGILLNVIGFTHHAGQSVISRGEIFCT